MARPNPNRALKDTVAEETMLAIIADLTSALDREYLSNVLLNIVNLRDEISEWLQQMGE